MLSEKCVFALDYFMPIKARKDPSHQSHHIALDLWVTSTALNQLRLIISSPIKLLPEVTVRMTDNPAVVILEPSLITDTVEAH
jgi:hypothetical protein